MAKRVLLVGGAVVYLASFVVGLILFFMVEGSFSLGSRYFWAYTGLPFIWILAHLAAGVLLLRKPEPAAPLVLAIEVGYLAWSVTGMFCFRQTFNLILMAALLRLAAAGPAFYWLWWPPKKNRSTMIAASGAGLVLAVVWVLSFQPAASGSMPAVTGPDVLDVWQRPPVVGDTSSDIWTVGLLLENRAQVVVDSATAGVEIRFEDALVSVHPLPRFERLSIDGLWTTRLNALGMAFQNGTNKMTWPAGDAQCAYLRYNNPRHVQSRLALSGAIRLAGTKPMSADFFAKVVTGRNAMELVAVTQQRRPLFPNRSLLFEIMVHSRSEHRVVVPGLVDTRFAAAEAPGATDPWLVNLQHDGAAAYRCSASLRPRDEEARVEVFQGWMAVEEVSPGKAMVLRFPDWQTQALREVSPAAGGSIAANHLIVTRVPVEGGKHPWPTALRIEAAVAATAIGSGGPPVRMNPGTYLNRMCIEFVPTGSDYAAVAAAMKPWPLPGSQAPE